MSLNSWEILNLLRVLETSLFYVRYSPAIMMFHSHIRGWIFVSQLKGTCMNMRHKFVVEGRMRPRLGSCVSRPVPRSRPASPHRRARNFVHFCSAGPRFEYRTGHFYPESDFPWYPLSKCLDGTSVRERWLPFKFIMHESFICRYIRRYVDTDIFVKEPPRNDENYDGQQRTVLWTRSRILVSSGICCSVFW
jgi:hypothetical protein